jgi:hypothetical protein
MTFAGYECPQGCKAVFPSCVFVPPSPSGQIKETLFPLWVQSAGQVILTLPLDPTAEN